MKLMDFWIFDVSIVELTISFVGMDHLCVSRYTYLLAHVVLGFDSLAVAVGVLPLWAPTVRNCNVGHINIHLYGKRINSVQFVIKRINNYSFN